MLQVFISTMHTSQNNIQWINPTEPFFWMKRLPFSKQLTAEHLPRNGGLDCSFHSQLHLLPGVCPEDMSICLNALTNDK